jgi:hypothetical protein
MENILLGVNIITISALFFSIIYTAGVVWRVEMELDVAYKFFLVAIVALLIAEVADLYYGTASIAIIVKSARMIFAACFLAGILFMRDIVRKLDGEKRK